MLCVRVENFHKIEVSTAQIGQRHDAMFRPELVCDDLVQTADHMAQQLQSTSGSRS
jgi:hypothetical protein